LELVSKLKRIHISAKKLRLSSVDIRNQVLIRAADLLLQNQNKILKANQKDLKQLGSKANAAFRDRLILNTQRIEHMALSLKQVAGLEDPLLTKSETQILKNGLQLKKKRSPLGLIFMIFESRPNVSIEAFSMGFKSGNAMILRGGKESRHSTSALYKILKQALQEAQLSDVLWGITDPDRKIVSALLKQKQYIDVVVPRGGESLIQHVVKNSLIPIIKNDRGLCHVYIHSDADLKMARAILLNSKTQRPAVCNSMETMLVHESIASQLLPLVYEDMRAFQVQWFGCAKTVALLNGLAGVKLAKLKNYNTEYLEQILNCKVVKSVEEAILHIDIHSSRHSESIVTTNEKIARQFQNEIDSAVIYWNASTRFTDGFEFGLGGELGISTQKLHVRGPVGLLALTNERWIVDGKGQIR
jgi:glutamate-5-semialdehyde dehydrogenase